MLLYDTLDLFGQDQNQALPQPDPQWSCEGGLYVIWLSPDKKHFYGGRTTCFARRWGVHLKDLRGGKHENPRMQNTYNKYQFFIPEVLSQSADKVEQIRSEQAWIDANFGHLGCVNLNPFASGGFSPLSPEAKARKSAKLRLRKLSPEHKLVLIECNRRRIWTLEMRTLRSELLRGTKRSAEQVARQVSTWKGNPRNIEKARITLSKNRHRITREGILRRSRLTGDKLRGRKQPPEVVEKRAAANRGQTRTPETRALMSRSAKARVLVYPITFSFSTRKKISEQLKGRVWLNQAGKNIRVPPERVPELLAQGWARGRVGGSNLGRVVLTRNGSVKLAPPEEVEGLLTQGWIRGLPDRLKGLVSVRSPEGTRSKVSPEKAEELLAQGWERGPGELPSRNWVHRTSGHEIERKQISDADLQDFLNQGWAQGSALPNTAGLLWIRKDNEPDRRILEGDLDCFLELGWELGQRRFLEPQTWIRRPKEEGYEFRMVPLGELGDWEQQGWERGYLERTPEVREKVAASWTPEKREAAKLRKQTQENTTRGSVWVNDGVKNKRVSEERALQLVAEGWQRGQIHRKAHGPMSEESRARVSEAHRKSWARRGGMSEEGKRALREKALQRHAQTPEKWATSDEKRAACSRSSAGRTWLTDGVHNKFASPEEAGGLLGAGWVRGRVQKSA